MPNDLTGGLIMKEITLDYLSKHNKAYTKTLYRIVGGKSSGYSLNKFRKYLQTLEDQNFIVYISETETSLPYWRLISEQRKVPR